MGGLFKKPKVPKDKSAEELRRQRAEKEQEEAAKERLRRAQAGGASSLLNPSTGFLGVPFDSGASTSGDSTGSTSGVGNT